MTPNTTTGGRRAKAKPFRLSLAQFVSRALPPLIGPRLGHAIYPRRLGIRDNYRFLTHAQTGSLLSGTTADTCGHVFAVNGYFEWRHWAIAAAVCSPGDTIVEIGANTGTETVGFADLVGPRGRIFAFEPAPDVVAERREALKPGGFDNVIVLHLAVSDQVGRISFAPSRDPHNTGRGYLMDASSTAATETLDVVATTLDQMAETLGPARLIAMDAEGSEPAILRGARGYLAQHRPVLILEADPRLNLRRIGSGLSDLHSELVNLGYRCFVIGRFGLKSIDLRAQHRMNWCCLSEMDVSLDRSISGAIVRSLLCPCVPGLNPIARKSAR